MEDIDNIRCEDLRTIDKLWVKYSNGRFGFSVQQHIYQSLGGKRKYDEKTWEAFGNKIGWRNKGNWLLYQEITFNNMAPEAHLPHMGSFLLIFGGVWFVGGVDFLSCVKTCDLPNPKSEIQNPKLASVESAELKSAVRMDYTRLRDLLAGGKWKEADEETARVMLAVAKREEEKWFRDKHIKNFPCQDLRTIDQLWLKYSNGRFGFSVQKRIYQGLDATGKHKLEIWEAFGDAVGWRKDGEWLVFYKDISFDITAPEAHLPIAPWKRGLGGLLAGLGCWVGSCLFSRIETCELSYLKLKVENEKLAAVESVELKLAVGMDYSKLRDVSLELLEISAVGMDYTKLRNLLAARKWEEADAETRRVMLAVAKQKESLRVKEDIDNFPCEDLRTIDYLWVKYSNGRFGFSVQKRIYESLGGTRKYDEKIKEAFGDTVGWRKGGSWLDCSDQNIFDIKAPEGHLPVGHLSEIKVFMMGEWEVIHEAGGSAFGMGLWNWFFSRVETCNL